MTGHTGQTGHLANVRRTSERSDLRYIGRTGHPPIGMSGRPVCPGTVVQKKNPGERRKRTARQSRQGQARTCETQNQRFFLLDRPGRIDEAGGRFSTSCTRSSTRFAICSYRSAISSIARFESGSPMSSECTRASSARSRQCWGSCGNGFCMTFRAINFPL
jgi:hypothetical protein